MTTATQDLDALRAEVESTRIELGETVAALAERADVKKRARQAVEQARQQARARAAATITQAKATALKARQSIREHPTATAGTAGGLLAAAGTIVALVAWQRSRRRPVSRAQRLWQAATSRFS